MRSRYSAYALGDTDYLLRTWHPSTRPASVPAGAGWLRLEVLATTGGLLDAEGSVHFRAHHVDGVLEERSRFVRDAGRWSYLGPL
jgi:SEC-C motif domain protein